MSAERCIGSRCCSTAKFLVKELAFGQFNLPVALLLIGAVIAAQQGRNLAAGAAVAAGVFVKPYALVMVPWLAWTQGWRPLVVFRHIGGWLCLPAASYGWNGNLTLLSEWYRTVTETTATESDGVGQHFVRVDVGEMAEPGRPPRPLRWSLRSSWSLSGSSSCCGGSTWLSRTISRPHTSACWSRSCHRRAGTTCS